MDYSRAFLESIIKNFNEKEISTGKSEADENVESDQWCEWHVLCVCLVFVVWCGMVWYVVWYVVWCGVVCMCVACSVSATTTVLLINYNYKALKYVNKQ